MLPVSQRRLLPAKIRNRAFIFWDTETTGIDVKYEKIVQMGAVASNGTHFLRLVNPERKIPQIAKAVHGISDEMVRNEPTFREVWKDFTAFVRKVELDGGGHVGVILVGHNTFNYDDLILTAELERIGQSISDLSPLEVLSGDTMAAAREAKKRGGIAKEASIKLAELLRRCCDGEELQNAHDALADAEAVSKIVVTPILAAFVPSRPFVEATVELARRRANCGKTISSADAAPTKKPRLEVPAPSDVVGPPKEEAPKNEIKMKPPSTLRCCHCRRCFSRFFEHICPSAIGYKKALNVDLKTKCVSRSINVVV
jgi:DNA polymerase III epsilon subunit-like protein